MAIETEFNGGQIGVPEAGDNMRQPQEHLTPELESQVDQLVGRYEAFNRLLPDHARRDERDFEFARKFFPMVLEERNSRAAEVETDRYKEVVRLAKEQLATDTYFVFCMDGRVLPPLVFGASFGISDGIRVPGANLQEFYRGEDGKKFLKEDSLFANLLHVALSKSDVITQVFDSHLACAARNAEEEKAGYHPKDAGLYVDVAYKKEMSEATRKFVADNYGDTKAILPIQTTFDPHNGFMLMGLETDESQSVAKKAAKPNARPEYTPEVIEELLSSGKIISTKELNEELQDLFARFDGFNLDWKEKFVETAESFWQAVAAMSKDAIPLIEAKLKSIYPNLENADQLSAAELRERAVILLASSFSGHMLNKAGAQTDKLDYKNGEGAYEYGDHREEFIKIYEGGHPPYNTSAFVLFSLDEQNLPAYTSLANDIVEENRRKGRVVDKTGLFVTPEEFEKATIPVVVHEIVREPMSEEGWHDLAQIDWSDLPDNWDQITGDEFKDYLSSKGIRNYEVIKNIDNLRKRMGVLYDSRNPLAHRFVRGELMALPTIVDKSRKNRFVVPFVKLGY